jgi:hypothetical protein
MLRNVIWSHRNQIIKFNDIVHIYKILYKYSVYVLWLSDDYKMIT